jgi:zinc transport system ATP-binding protein
MEQLGIWAYRGHRIGQLSGGERQRAFIARALVTRPRLLLLDEPTANLDARGQAELFDLLRSLTRDMTVIMVTHDVGVVSSYVTAVACVNQCLHYHATGKLDEATLAETYGHPLAVLAHDHLPLHHLHQHNHADHG